MPVVLLGAAMIAVFGNKSKRWTHLVRADTKGFMVIRFGRAMVLFLGLCPSFPAVDVIVY